MPKYWSMLRKLGLRIGLAHFLAAGIMFLLHGWYTQGVGGCHGFANGILFGMTVGALLVLGVTMCIHPILGAYGSLFGGGFICLYIPQALGSIVEIGPGPTAVEFTIMGLAVADVAIGVMLLRKRSSLRTMAGDDMVREPDVEVGV